MEYPAITWVHHYHHYHPTKIIKLCKMFSN